MIAPAHSKHVHGIYTQINGSADHMTHRYKGTVELLGREKKNPAHIKQVAVIFFSNPSFVKKNKTLVIQEIALSHSFFINFQEHVNSFK